MITLSQPNEKGLSVLCFEPPLYTACDRGQVNIVLHAQDRADLIALLEAEQAAETGDANTPWQDDEYVDACPICSAPLRINETCSDCLLELRCDDGGQ